MSEGKVTVEEAVLAAISPTSRRGLDPLRVSRARDRISAQGINLSDWARRHGFDVTLVHAVMSGKRSCRRGQSHRIAVLLDLKDGELDDIDQRLGGSPTSNAEHR